MAGSRRHRSVLIAGVLLALGCVLAIYAAAASAATTRVDDAKRETTALAENGRVDIIAVSGARFGSDLRFLITMRQPVRKRPGKERPLLIINTRGGGKSDAEFLVYGNDVFDISGPNTKVIGKARLTPSGRTWSYRFDPREIPRLDRYGWAVLTEKGAAADVAPDDRYVKAQA